jgi:hypothetical protein
MASFVPATVPSRAYRAESQQTANQTHGTPVIFDPWEVRPTCGSLKKIAQNSAKGATST